jgi:hypothetical protein
VNGGWLRAARAGSQCAPALLRWRFRAAPQLHRQAAELTATLGFVVGALPGGLNEVGIHLHP